MYDISISVYKGNKSKISYIYKPYGTVHEQSPSNILKRGLSSVISNSIDKKHYLKSRWKDKEEVIDYVKKSFVYIESSSKNNGFLRHSSARLYREYYKQNPVNGIPETFEQVENVYGVGGLMDKYGLKENIIQK